jgi:hypothetical protein
VLREGAIPPDGGMVVRTQDVVTMAITIATGMLKCQVAGSVVKSGGW